MIDFIDKTSEQNGTPINREYLMAIQGFMANETVFKDDGSVEEINGKGEKLTTTFPDADTIVETFVGVGKKTIIKTTKFNKDGSISETLSEVIE